MSSKKNTTEKLNDSQVAQVIELCDQYFVGYMVQMYAGADYECLYCQAMENRQNQSVNHKDWCPVEKYRKIRCGGVSAEVKK